MNSDNTSIRVMTYNIHKCLGKDKQHRPERIIEIIRTFSPDIIALQEVDVGYKISGGINQAQLLADEFKLHSHFQPAIQQGDTQYGNMLLSRFPFKIKQHQVLPDTPLSERKRLYERMLNSTYEPRSAFLAQVDTPGNPLHVVVTHLGLAKKERLRQGEVLVSKQWLGSDALNNESILLLGDLNDVPGSVLYQTLTQRLKNAQVECDDHRVQKTFYSWLPLRCLDHIFYAGKLHVRRVEVPKSSLARLASDHLPIIADFEWV